MADIKGIYYYKHAGYPGTEDETLNHSLTGAQIDGNFYFLEGNDIKDVAFEENALTVTKVNNEKTTVDLSSLAEITELDFDEKTGTLTIRTATQPEGISVNGFLSLDSDLHIATDNTIKGNGTPAKPLGIADTEKTGQFAPADTYIDLTEYPAAVLSNGVEPGYRVVTKEIVGNFGLLYTLDAAKALDDYLKDTNTGWHVPTREEWAEMLNSVEDPCGIEVSDHYSTESDVLLGKTAGEQLKSKLYWNEETSGESRDCYGFSALPLGSTDEEGTEPAELGTQAIFWTLSEEETKQQYYVRGFMAGTPKVYQSTWDKARYAAVRLVKDTKEDYHQSVVINGMTLPCVQMPDGSIWTATNAAFPMRGSKSLQVWETLTGGTSVKFFINTFDGKEWTKRELADGSSIVIKQKEAIPFVLWMVRGDELFPLNAGNTTASTEELWLAVNTLTDNLANEAAVRLADDEALEDRVAALEEQVSALTEEIAEIRADMADIVRDSVLDILKRTIHGYPKQIDIVYENAYGQVVSDLNEAEEIIVKFAHDAEFVADMNRENTGDTQTIEYEDINNGN